MCAVEVSRAVGLRRVRATGENDCDAGSELEGDRLVEDRGHVPSIGVPVSPVRPLRLFAASDQLMGGNASGLVGEGFVRVGLGGLEPLTSALSGPAAPRRSAASRSASVHERPTRSAYAATLTARGPAPRQALVQPVPARAALAELSQPPEAQYGAPEVLSAARSRTKTVRCRR